MPAVKAPSIEPARMERVYRGVTFVLIEQDADAYDEVLTKATSKVFNDITGRQDDVVDENLLLRLLLAEALVEPKGQTRFPTRLQRQLERDVRELHFGIEPAENKDDEKKDDEDESPNAEGG